MHCEILKKMKDEIEAGKDPEAVIPYSIECGSLDDYIEVLHFAVQVLPDGKRKDEVKELLKGVIGHASR